MGEEVVRSDVDDTWETRDDAQDELEVLEKHEEHVDNDQNERETKTNINFEAPLKHQSRENVCKPEEVSSYKNPPWRRLLRTIGKETVATGKFLQFLLLRIR